MSQRLDNIHNKVIQSFTRMNGNDIEQRRQQQADRLFMIPGQMWSDELKEQYENKPQPEINKLELAIKRIINNYRNNRFEAKFSTKIGTTNKNTDLVSDLYRSFKQESNSIESYDNAFQGAITGGVGAWRLRTAYKYDDDDENEEQIIVSEPIFDPETSVFFIGCNRADKRDATGCLVLSEMPRDEYEEKYDDSISNWPRVIPNDLFSWYSRDTVTLAEYYDVEIKNKEIHIFRGIDDLMPVKRYEKDDLTEELLQELQAMGYTLSNTKKVKKKQIHKYILSYSKILEDCGIIAGNMIPVVMCYGNRTVINGIEVSYGHVRPNRDIAMIYNCQYSKVLELATLSSIEKPILTPEQVNGHENMWADDGVENYPYLLINPITDVNGSAAASGPVGYTKPPVINPATASLLQMAYQDYNDLLGNQSLGEKLDPQMSGKALNAIHDRLDLQSYIYMSEFEKALEWEAKIWLGMAKEIYVENDREMRIVDKAGNSSTIQMNTLGFTEDGGFEDQHNITKEEFDVSVSVGAATTSRKNATVAALTQLLPYVEAETRNAVLGTIIANLDGEGLDDVQEYNHKKLVLMGVGKPSEDEKVLIQQLQGQEDANTTYLKAAAAEADAKAAANRADTMVKIANADKIRADTAKIVKELSQQEDNSRVGVQHTPILHPTIGEPKEPKLPPINVNVTLPSISINNIEKDKEDPKEPSVINVTMPEICVEPNITVNTPDVSVEPTINVTTPEVCVEPNIQISQPESNKQIEFEYDKQGNIVGATSETKNNTKQK